MRFVARELTPSRIVAAVARRVREVPHLVAWNGSGDALRNRERLGQLEGRHAGQRCFVLGNGPSLATMDLSPLRDEVTFGTNRIYLMFEQMGFVPTYYASINELVLEQYHRDIAQLDMVRFVSWNARAHFGADDPRLLFVRTGYPLRDFFGRDPRHALCSGGTITFVALQLAYFMGFQEVVLIGVDHRFSGRGTPNRVQVRTAERDEDHCHPDYFPKGSRWQLPDLLRSELAYALARDAFERDGRRVLDATVDGRCPVFEKADFASLVSR